MTPTRTPPRRPPSNRPAPLHIGTVPYLNVEPLIRGLAEADSGVELIAAVPRRLAAMLASGSIEVGIVPIAEVLLREGWRVVPGLCIGCDGPVWSVMLVSKVPPQSITSLLLDCSSMTSVLLGQVILRECYNVTPKTTLSNAPLRADMDFAADPHDAFILIGNEAMRLPTAAFAHRIDLGEAWKQLTGLPFVFAVWATREERIRGRGRGEAARERIRRIITVLHDAARRGSDELDSVCEEAARRHDFPEPVVRRYLREIIHHTLGEAEQRAIAEFARRLVERKLCGKTFPLTCLGAEVGGAKPRRLKPSIHKAQEGTAK